MGRDDLAARLERLLPTGTSDTDELVFRTYRYVRVLIVVLTIGLLASVLVEGATAGCVLGSISAYYYTPARGLFTSGLIGIGVCLIAIRSENDFQDSLLNVAGLLGPMVALIPMHLPVGTVEHPSREALCIINAHRVEGLRPGAVREGAFELVTGGREDAIRNGTFALLIMLTVGLVLLGTLIWAAHRRPRKEVPMPKWWPWILSVLGAVGVWALYMFAHSFYIERLHFLSALAMFAAVSVFAVVDGIQSIARQKARKRGGAYVVLGVGLLTGSGLIMCIGNSKNWDYTTFTAEVWGISVFLVFWVAQTIDLWNHNSRSAAIEAANRAGG